MFLLLCSYSPFELCPLPQTPKAGVCVCFEQTKFVIIIFVQNDKTVLRILRRVLRIFTVGL